MRIALIFLAGAASALFSHSSTQEDKVRDKPSAVATASPIPNARDAKMLEHLPVAFVPNLGQWDHSARYLSRFGATTAFLQDQGWTLSVVERSADWQVRELINGRSAFRPHEAALAPGRGAAVRMSFVGAKMPALVAGDQLPGRHNYFLGNDSSKWRSDVPLYACVKYQQIYEGVDICVRGQDGHMEFDVLLQAGARLELVEIAVEGIESMRIDADGAMIMQTRLGTLRMPAPKTWQNSPAGEKAPVSCRYAIRGESKFGFAVDGIRHEWTLTVDPGLIWSTFLGATTEDFVRALAVDAQGSSTIAGFTNSSSFPVTPGALDISYNGTGDVFVTRLSPNGSSLVYSTFLGGANSDQLRALALDTYGAVTLAGSTISSDFPVTSGAYDTGYNGNTDVFVARLSPNGSSLVYSTYLGGVKVDEACAVAVDSQGATTVAGTTDRLLPSQLPRFPTTPGAFDTSYHGGTDGFVTRLSATGSSLIYSTLFGGANFEEIHGLIVDSQGSATVTGTTNSGDFPTTPGGFDTSYNGGGDAFVIKFAPSGSSLLYSTFIGGLGLDYPTSIVGDSQGGVVVAGSTTSTDFPTTPGAFGVGNSGLSDAFVVRLAPDGSNLVYSTYMGGVGTDIANAVAIDSQDAVTIAGETSSPNFPATLGAFSTTLNSGGPSSDAFVARLSPSGSRLAYSTFLGGSQGDTATALGVDAQGIVTVAGSTASHDFPTTSGVISSSYNGGLWDAFVARLDMLPVGVSAFGSSSPGCNGSLAMSVEGMPSIGNPIFALSCSNAPANTSGLCVLTGSRFASPAPVIGIDLWVDPSMVFVPLTANSNSIGASSVPMPVPANPAVAGGRLFAQFLWAGPATPPPCPPLRWSASNALEIIIQP